MNDDRSLPVSKRLRELIHAYGKEDTKHLSDYLSLLEERAKRWELDPLTGLYSREYMSQKLSEELRGSCDTTKPVSFAMLDLDKFKAVNDHLGHLEGDRVLLETAIHFLEALGESFPLRKGDAARKADAVGRYGGDEFQIVLPETILSGAFSAINRIRKRIEDQEHLHGVTVSGGVAQSDIVGVPLVYDDKGRDVVRRYADNGSRDNPNLKEAIRDYAGRYGTTPQKVMLMLDNLHRFLVDKKINPDSLKTDFEKIAVDLITDYADKALYHAKGNGKNTVYAHGEEGFGTYRESGLWSP